MVAAVDAEMQALLGALKAEGHIDSQFEQLLQLQDDSDPDFVQSVMDLFCKARPLPAGRVDTSGLMLANGVGALAWRCPAVPLLGRRHTDLALASATKLHSGSVACRILRHR